MIRGRARDSNSAGPLAGVMGGHVEAARGLELLGLRVAGGPGHGQQDQDRGLRVPSGVGAVPGLGRASLLPDSRVGNWRRFASNDWGRCNVCSLRERFIAVLLLS